MKPSHGKHEGASIQGEGLVNDSASGFRFTRIFPALSPFVVKMSVARSVGELMTSPDVARGDSNIPVGYTYFGQFVDHDITRDVTEATVGEADNPNTDAIEQTMDQDLVQRRSPSLDLDSVYGTPTEGGGASPLVDGVRFSFQATQTSPGAGNSAKQLRYDLHRGRSRNSSGEEVDVVLIPDNRNDENLAVAQMHALWMRFHNRIVTELERAEPTTAPQVLFSRARDLTTKHYQYIVLHDFLGRVCDVAVHDDVIKKGKSKHFTATAAETPAMPLEFSVAAYRMGHSMVRDDYEWNLNFSTGGTFNRPANFDRPNGQLQDLSLFAFTTTSGMLSETNPLPTNWIVDWRNLFDFSDTNFDVDGVQPQFAKALDPYISSGMRNIPGEMNNLATANLRRSGLRGLPSGQDVSRAMSSVKVLSASEMTNGLDPLLSKAVRDFQFAEKAPLWFYILQEANVRGNGDRLGEMGSRIVCETFAALVNASRPSVLQEGWKPADSPIKFSDGTSVDTISRLLAFIDEVDPVINPLGDTRL